MVHTRTRSSSHSRARCALRIAIRGYFEFEGREQAALLKRTRETTSLAERARPRLVTLYVALATLHTSWDSTNNPVAMVSGNFSSSSLERGHNRISTDSGGRPGVTHLAWTSSSARAPV
jgi:hypothetical protein